MKAATLLSLILLSGCICGYQHHGCSPWISHYHEPCTIYYFDAVHVNMDATYLPHPDHITIYDDYEVWYYANLIVHVRSGRVSYYFYR